MNQGTAARTTTPPPRLGARDQGKRMTLAAFLAADYEEGFRYELIHGRLFVSPIPNRPHDRLLKWLRRQLEDYSELHPEVFNDVSGPARLILAEPDDDVSAPEPDLVCYRDYPTDVPEGESTWELGSPVLVVEIISEGTADKDLERNPALYLQVPTLLEYWIIDPRESYDHPSMTVYRRRGQRWQKPIEVEAGGTYSTRFLPGFTLILDRRAG
jgi:Uma2 family endonuclease